MSDFNDIFIFEMGYSYEKLIFQMFMKGTKIRKIFAIFS